VLSDEQREMIDEEEWDWLIDHSLGEFDHLVIASTLPVFMSPGIHHLEAWNEAVCAGRWGRLMARLGEKLRRGVDLEHWSAFNTSFERLCDWLRRIAAGTANARPPATIVLLGGDVHNASLSRVDLGTVGGSRVYQVVCSPFRNPLSAMQRRAVRLTGSRGAARIFSLLARLAGVPVPSAEWQFIRRPSFDNSIGEVYLDRRAAEVKLQRSAREGEDTERLHLLHVSELSSGD
jgi:hypothetical protein